jgi:hypothetical protein
MSGPIHFFLNLRQLYHRPQTSPYPPTTSRASLHSSETRYQLPNTLRTPVISSRHSRPSYHTRVTPCHLTSRVPTAETTTRHSTRLYTTPAVARDSPCSTPALPSVTRVTSITHVTHRPRTAQGHLPHQRRPRDCSHDLTTLTMKRTTGGQAVYPFKLCFPFFLSVVYNCVSIGPSTSAQS